MRLHHYRAAASRQQVVLQQLLGAKSSAANVKSSPAEQAIGLEMCITHAAHGKCRKEAVCAVQAASRCGSEGEGHGR